MIKIVCKAAQSHVWLSQSPRIEVQQNDQLELQITLQEVIDMINITAQEETIADNGRPEETMADHGRPEETIADHGRPEKTMANDSRREETMADHSRPEEMNEL